MWLLPVAKWANDEVMLVEHVDLDLIYCPKLTRLLSIRIFRIRFLDSCCWIKPATVMDLIWTSNSLCTVMPLNSYVQVELCGKTIGWWNKRDTLSNEEQRNKALQLAKPHGLFVVPLHDGFLPPSFGCFPAASQSQSFSTGCEWDLTLFALDVCSRCKDRQATGRQQVSCSRQCRQHQRWRGSVGSLLPRFALRSAGERGLRFSGRTPALASKMTTTQRIEAP